VLDDRVEAPEGKGFQGRAGAAPVDDSVQAADGVVEAAQGAVAVADGTSVRVDDGRRPGVENVT
jgi:hypothetical protein